MTALSSGTLLAADWLFATDLAQGATSVISSKNGVLKLTLTAEEKLIAYGKTTRWAMTYNGTFPAPTLRAKPGDTLQIKLVNRLSHPTNLHTHGLHTSPSGHGDNPLLMIKPGQSFDYTIVIPKTQKSGTFWYHPHHHELSAGQVSSGLAGALIVEDNLDSLPIIKKSTERVIVLADPRIGNNSSVAQTSQMDLMHGRSGPNTLVNGLLIPSYTAVGSAAERWRVVNSCVSQYQTLSIPGADLIQLSSDSSRLSRPSPTPLITIAPGQRTEFLVRAPKAGVYLLQNEVQPLAKISFTSASEKVAFAPLLPFTPIAKVNAHRTINVVGSGMGMMGGAQHEAKFTFDGKSFDPKRIDQKVKFGSTEEWTISNPSSMHHPFHLHAWPFQVSDDGFGNYLEGWHDTVNLPAGGTVKIRIPFVDISGTTVYHCHILDHEDAGMMGIIRVS